MGIADLQIELEQLLRGCNANDDEVQAVSELTKGYVERMNILNFLKINPQTTIQKVVWCPVPKEKNTIGTICPN